MSWNNVLPWWVYEVDYENYLASCSCCFDDEWLAGISRSVPAHVAIKMIERRKEPDDQQKFYKELYKA